MLRYTSQYAEIDVLFEHFISGSENPVVGTVRIEVATDYGWALIINDILKRVNDFFDKQGIHEARIISVDVVREV